MIKEIDYSNVPGVSEVVAALLWSDTCDDTADGELERITGAFGGLPQEGFDFGAGLLDGVEIGRIRWQIKDVCAFVLDHFAAPPLRGAHAAGSYSYRLPFHPERSDGQGRRVVASPATAAWLPRHQHVPVRWPAGFFITVPRQADKPIYRGNVNTYPQHRFNPVAQPGKCDSFVLQQLISDFSRIDCQHMTPVAPIWRGEMLPSCFHCHRQVSFDTKDGLTEYLAATALMLRPVAVSATTRWRKSSE